MTTEVFCPEKEQWMWMDVSLEICHAMLCGEISLNFYEFMRFFNSSYEEKISLTLGSNAADTGGKGCAVNECSKYQLLVGYFNHNQHFHIHCKIHIHPRLMPLEVSPKGLGVFYRAVNVTGAKTGVLFGFRILLVEHGDFTMVKQGMPKLESRLRAGP